MACEWALHLCEGNSGAGWDILGQLGKCDHMGNLQHRCRFLDYALSFSPSDYIEDLLNARKELDLTLMYMYMRSRLDSRRSADSDEIFEDAQDYTKEVEEEFHEDDEDFTQSTLNSSSLDPQKFISVTSSVLSTNALSLLSAVRSKDLLADTVNILSPLKEFMTSKKFEEEDSDLSKSNVDFSLQGCHAFYAGKNSKMHISNLGPTYKNYKISSFTDPGFELPFTILHIALLKYSFDDSCSSEDVEVSKELIKRVLPEDSLFGFSLLSRINDPHHVFEILSGFHKTLVLLQMSLYYYALQIYLHYNPHYHRGTPSAYLSPPTNVIDSVRKIIEEKQMDITDQTVGIFIQYFKEADRLVGEFTQGQRLYNLDAGVDVERFLSETEYKKDTVLGLAMSSDSGMVNMALTLAKEYSIPLWEVYAAHVQYLFEFEVNVDAIEKQIFQTDLIHDCKEYSDDFIAVIEEKLFSTIDGTDHQKLLILFSLLCKVQNDSTKRNRAEQHHSLLRKINDFVPELDYKPLIDFSTNILKTLTALLDEKHSHIFVQVVHSLQKDENSAIDTDDLLSLWIHESFYAIPGNKKKCNAGEWVKRFEKLEHILVQVNSKDVESFARSLICTEDGFVRVPIQASKEIITKIMIICSSKINSSQGTPEFDSWLDVRTSLKDLELHSERLRSETFKQLYASSNPQLKRYALQFAISGGREAVLDELPRQILLDKCSLNTLRSILSVYPEENPRVPEDILMDVFREILCDLDLHDEQVKSQWDNLNHILKELRSYWEEGGDLLDEDEVLDVLRDFASNEEKSLPARIEILNVAQKFFQMTESDAKLLNTLKAGGILKDVLSTPSEVEEGLLNLSSPLQDEISDTEEDSRKELLSTLVGKMDSLRKARSAVELLTIWPKFESQFYANLDSNPWLRIFMKLLDRFDSRDELEAVLNFIYSNVINSFEEKQITPECINHLVSRILDLPDAAVLKYCFKIVLKCFSKSSIFYERLIQSYKALSIVEASHYDEELFSLIVEGSAVTDVSHTALFSPFVDFLGGKPNLAVAAMFQLESSNHWIEAASLSLAASSLPRAMKVVSNFVNEL